MQEELKKVLEKAIADLGVEGVPVILDRPADPKHGDYSSNVALVAAKKLGKSPREVAEILAKSIGHRAKSSGVEKVEVAGAGFINFYLSTEYLLSQLQTILENDIFVPTGLLKGKKIMVEYAHPNTHKEMHIGHMRTLITGQAIARILEANGATVFRANYQGDIGPHVAKAMWGIEKLMTERKLTLQTVSAWPNNEKAHFLGEGYALGSQEYEENKDEIDGINTELYQLATETKGAKETNETKVWDMYKLTRQWSLDYYNDFYKRFYTKFDELFFESDMVSPGKDIVMENIGKVFRKENGAIIFPGEDYGLHTRVFITQAGNPTYEGKEMGNAFAEEKAFPFDLKVHIVASEQAGYFQVVFKALELIDPEKFKEKQHHVSMGMVTLTDRKMSSRTGDVVTVDWLLDEVKKKVDELFSGDRVMQDEKQDIAEQVTIAAVKHSVLRVGATQNVAFSIEKSVSLEGDSGPYLQYTYVRTQSVLAKVGISNIKYQMSNIQLEPEELALLRQLGRFGEAVEEAAQKYNPSVLATYLFDLARDFNLFYQKVPILKPPHPDLLPHGEKGKNSSSPSRGEDKGEGEDVRTFRLALTEAVGKRMKQGLHLLGITAPEKM
jgi:arginyl-tRNA synthetase